MGEIDWYVPYLIRCFVPPSVKQASPNRRESVEEAVYLVRISRPFIESVPDLALKFSIVEVKALAENVILKL